MVVDGNSVSASRTAASPCTNVVTSRANARCASRFSGAVSTSRSSCRDRRLVEKRVVAQEAPDIPVIDAQEELIEIVRRRARGIEPHRALLDLAEFWPAAVMISGIVRP